MSSKLYRNALIQCLEKLEIAYAPKMSFDQKDVDEWYSLFENFDSIGLQRAVERCIEEEKYPPTPAVLIHYYKLIDNERKELQEVICRGYVNIRSVWGENYDRDTYKEIVRYIYNFPKRQRKVEMLELQYRAVSYAHDCDACGRKEKPTIKQFVRGIR